MSKRKVKVEPSIEVAEALIVSAVKAFNADFKCRDHQFEIGQTYTVAGAIKACSNGFHACDQSPLDVWGYYPLFDGEGRMTRYADVALSGKTDRDGNKIAAAQITINAELFLPDLITRFVNWVAAATSKTATDDDDARLASSGNDARLASSGNDAQLASSGNGAQLASSGYYARLASSGNDAQLASSGYDAQLASSGNGARLASSGNGARLASSGYYARLASSGNGGVITSSARDAWAKGSAGTHISLAWFDAAGKCGGFANGLVGTDGIEPDTWYRAAAGRLVAA